MIVVHHRSHDAVAARRRGMYVYGGRPGRWGNPFVLVLEEDRTTVIRRFRRWFYAPEQAALRAAARLELQGNIMVGCFCKPRACHLDVIAAYVNRSRA